MVKGQSVERDVSFPEAWTADVFVDNRRRFSQSSRTSNLKLGHLPRCSALAKSRRRSDARLTLCKARCRFERTPGRFVLSFLAIHPTANEFCENAGFGPLPDLVLDSRGSSSDPFSPGRVQSHAINPSSDEPPQPPSGNLTRECWAGEVRLGRHLRQSLIRT